MADMSPRYFLQSPSPRHCWPRSVWPRFRVFPPRPARWPKIQLVNYLLTPLQLILIHTRVCSGNTITPQATPCRSSPPPSCTRGGCVRAVSPPRTRAAPP